MNVSSFRNVDELLFTLEAKHWQVGNLSVDVNHCYGPNLLFFWPHNIVGIITLLMNVTDYMNQKIHPTGTLVHLVQQLIAVLIFLCTIIYFSRTGTLMTNEVSFSSSLIKSYKNALLSGIMRPNPFANTCITHVSLLFSAACPSIFIYLTVSWASECFLTLHFLFPGVSARISCFGCCKLAVCLATRLFASLTDCIIR